MSVASVLSRIRRRNNEPAERATELQPDTVERYAEPPVLGARLNTFQGVYRPTLLTILGVMMYLREGWIVGEAGLLGAVMIILLIFLITGTAALSLSSITTNIRVGTGGVFYIISQALGLEPGGSIGIPLYLGQALSAALYIYGFSEAWTFIFPGHPQLAVAYGVFVVALATTFISTRLAFRVQGAVMLVILASLVSIILGLTQVGGPRGYFTPELWGRFEGGGFWMLFAIFFPAGTGVMVGANMSGALADPRRSIPRGTLGAVATALAVYLFMAVWYSVVASPEELRENYLAVVDNAAWGGLVLAGILASTFTASLSSLVAAPRILFALGEQRVVPRGSFIARLTPSEEPRNAIIVTGLLVAITLLIGSLDRVAVLITMFFLLTYLAINLIMVIEQSLGMISFRPLFTVPRWIPLAGLAACVLALFVISPTFALIALSIIVGIYAYLTRQRLQTPWETVRSSIFVALADWAAREISRTPEEANERSWKPDLLVPVESRGQLDGTYRFLRLIVEPRGSISVIGIRRPRENGTPATRRTVAGLADSDLFGPRSEPFGADSENEWRDNSPNDDLETLAAATAMFRKEDIFATSTIIEAPSLVKGVEMSAAVLRGSYFKPNILFGLAHLYNQDTLQGLADTAEAYRMGLALLYRHEVSGLGYERVLNVWVSDQSPEWKLGLRLANLDLTLLLALQLTRNFGGRMRLSTVVSDPKEVPKAEAFLHRLIRDARLRPNSEIWIRQGRFMEQVAAAPRADVHVLGLARQVDRSFLKTVVRLTGSTCLFVRDSGRESALA